MSDVTRHKLELEAGLNLEPPDETFDQDYSYWEFDSAHPADYDTWPQCTQRQMLLGMIQREHTDSETFFRIHHGNRFRTVLTTHCMTVCFECCPNSLWLGHESHEVVLPLPWWPNGHKAKKPFMEP